MKKDKCYCGIEQKWKWDWVMTQFIAYCPECDYHGYKEIKALRIFQDFGLFVVYEIPKFIKNKYEDIIINKYYKIINKRVYKV